MLTFIKIVQNSGFFSCCSVILDHIIHYYNTQKKLPDIVDTNDCFSWYKPNDDSNNNITNEYFENYQNKGNIDFVNCVDYKEVYQFNNYKQLDYQCIKPFIHKYFSPSEKIKQIIRTIENKYSIKDYNNLCVLFYRGNDKSLETKLCNYNEYIKKAISIIRQNPKIQFLIQSDETEFIETMLQLFPDSIYFKDEIRHINKSNNTVDKIFKDTNHLFSKYFLAITIIMSKCSTIVCGTGNCSMWIMFYRENANNVHQILENDWIS